tara:strand:+ start:172 stop:444 length:273 start_codon:yes stop_codon:yes gene_type:complete
MKRQKIPKKIIDQIQQVSIYAGDCDDWVTIKKEIMKSIPSDLRKLFSRRDPITKEQSPNSFDYAIIEHYFNLTGIDLKIRSLAERRELNS